MEVIGIGNLFCDIYHKDNKVIGINGGKSEANIIFNLANMGVKTKVIGNCGNDVIGKIAIDSLNKVGVDIIDIKIHNILTNYFNIYISENKINTKIKRSLIYNQKEIVLPDYINLTKDIIYVIDSIKYINILKGKIVMLDIGYSGELKRCTENELNNFLNFDFEILNINYRVAKYIINKFNLKSIAELYKLLNAKLIIITKGKEGATYLFNNKEFNFELLEIVEEVDPNGAGDIFFASTINDYLDNKLLGNEKSFKESFDKASLLSKEVVKVIGARSYYQNLYKLD